MIPKTSPRPRHPFVRLWLKRRQWRKVSALGALFSLLNKIFDIAPEILIGVAVDLVVQKEQSFLARFLGTEDVFILLLAMGTLTFVIWSLESCFEFLQQLTWRRLAQRVQHALRMEAFSQSIHHDLAWFEAETTGNYITTLNEDVHQLERFLDGGINTIIQLICSTFLVSLVFFYISPLIAFLSLLPMPLIALWSRYFHKKLLPLYQKTRSASQEIATRLSNVFSGIIVVKSFHQERSEMRTMERLSQAYVDAHHRAIKTSSAFTPTVRIFILLGFLSTLLVGGYLCVEGDLAVGSYSALVFLTQRLLWPFTDLANIVDQYQRGMASTARIMNFIGSAPHRTSTAASSTPTQPPIPQNLSLSFQNVGFRYAPPPQPLILHGIDLEARTGEIIGLCGSTGGGKSTLMKLLLRFYQPSQGRILLGERDLTHYAPLEVRQHIALVSQDTFLFDGTLEENIKYGNAHASLPELEEVLMICKLKEWIHSLPAGLRTPIGERGMKLSGGQKQRLALARALLKKAPILVLDEATSAIDNDTERDISSAIYSLAHQHITVLIAHRLSTLRHAHRIYVLEKGTISQSGTHDELVRHPGTYQQLWSIQTATHWSPRRSADRSKKELLS